MPAYVPDPTDRTQPVDSVKASTAAAEFRALKGYVQDNIGGGGGGGAVAGVFYENNQVVAADYTLTAGKNAMSAGPISINSGVTVTVPSGATWSIV